MVQSSQQLYQQLVNHERAPAQAAHTLGMRAEDQRSGNGARAQLGAASACLLLHHPLPGAVGTAAVGDRDADIEPSAEDEEAVETVGEETGRLESEYALSRLGPVG